MGETKIEWAHYSFNPWIGCTKVSDACTNCYAEALARRYGWATWGPGETRRRTSEANWLKPLAWNKAAERDGVRRRVFCASLADWADVEVDDAWRRDLFQLIFQTPNLEWLLLSKRHALVRGFLHRHVAGARNIRVGMTVENNDMAIIRLTRLRQVKEDGWPTFVSYEPALGPVDWERWLDRARHEACVDWLICGGESGAKARPMDPDWARAARDACQRHSIPFHFKQHGEWIGVPDLRNLPNGGGPGFGAYDHCTFDMEHEAVRVGKKAAGALLDGREWREFPT